MLTFRRLLYFSAVAGLVTSCLNYDSVNYDSQIQQDLRNLDEAIMMRNSAEQRKVDRINSLKTSLRVSRSYQDQIAIAKDLVNEYFPYQFDSTLAWIGRCREIAQKANMPDDVNWADIKQGEAMASAGYYIESWDVLNEKIDRETLPDDLLPNYFYSLHRLADNLLENSLPYFETMDLKSSRDYADTLLTLYEPGTYEWDNMRVYQLAADKNFVQARKANAELMSRLDTRSHNYAKTAWFESVLCDSLGLDRDKLHWEIVAANVDFINSVKDYAALNLVSNDLLDKDINRSFRYVQTAMEDAVFYGAKLRPWQISQFLLDIQTSYETKAIKANHRLEVLLWGITILSLLLILGLFSIIKTTRRLARSKQEVEKLNSQLQEANDDIRKNLEALSESNQIKERYIGLFLSQISENIDKVKSMESNIIKQLRYGKSEQLLKETLASTSVEDETDAFYDTFDTTFLAMFPDFVSQFNDLLQEPIVLKKGEKLNTELRIFALIRLGIEDSNVIAGLLKYSVRTIYNYKVKIRNSARIPREEFDEKVRKIG